MAQDDRLFERARAVDALAWCRKYLPDGKLRGAEWWARNPMRDDQRIGSFSVNVRAGMWYDLATDEGGDIIDLHAAMHRCSLLEAARQLTGDDLPPVPESLRRRATVTQIDDHRPEVIMPVPIDAPAPPGHHLGRPTHTWIYRDTERRELARVSRFETSDGKTYRPCVYTSAGWQWRKPPRAPLYGMERLRDGAPVLICEGEKAADAAHAMVGGAYVCLSWMGGSSAVERADWTPLTGREVIIWRDADEAGIRASQHIVQRLTGTAASVRCMRIPEGVPQGWDAADADPAEWSPARIAELSRPEVSHLPLDVPMPAGVIFPDMSDRNKLLNTWQNLEFMLSHYGISASYDEIAKRVDVEVPGLDTSQDCRDSVIDAVIRSIAVRNRMPHSHLGDYLTVIADRDRRNPVRDWISSAPWDGVDRVGPLLATLHTPHTELRDALVWRWLLTAYEGATTDDPAWKAHGVLVLQGPQGSGKTTWLESLAPRQWVAQGVSVDPSDKDTVLQAIQYWIVELGELDGIFRKSDIAALKAFVTRSEDTIRLPYARRASSMKRRTVFFASVNNRDYLVDTTGNRRWWTVPVTSIDYDHGIDTQQMWAQVAEMYRRGQRGQLLPREHDLLTEQNAGHMAASPYEDAILSRLDWDAPRAAWRSGRTCSQVLAELGWDRKPTAADCRETARVLRDAGAPQDEGAKRPVRFTVPPTKNS